MDLRIAVLVSILVAISTDYASTQDCTEVPIEIPLEACCLFPNCTDTEIEKQIEEMAKNVAPTMEARFGIICKSTQTVFTKQKIIKDNIWNKEEYSKMIDAQIEKEDEHWKQPLIDSFDECQEIVMSDPIKLAELFSKPPFNIKKEDCDPRHLVMMTCLHIDAFAKCPAKAWKVSENDDNYKSCKNTEKWTKKCGKDIEALHQILLIES